MRLLVATGLYPPEVGGPATYTALLEERLPALGIEVSVLPFAAVRHLPKILRHVAYFWKCFSRARQVDAVYAQDTVSVGFPAMLAAKLAGKKFIVRVPGDYAWEQGRQRYGVTDLLDVFQTRQGIRTYGFRVSFLRRIQTSVVRSAGLVIAPSKYLKSIIQTWAPAQDVRLVYNGVELGQSYAYRPKGSNSILSVGRLVPWKGFAELIDTVAEEPHWQLEIVGAGPEEKHLTDLINKKNAADRIVLTGKNLSRAEVLQKMSVADAFVLYSSYEGLSHTLVEATSCGVPIIASDIPANREVIEDEKSGLLVPLSDAKALHAALARVLEHPEEARAFGAAAHAVSDRFSFNQTALRTAEILKELCAS